MMNRGVIGEIIKKPKSTFKNETLIRMCIEFLNSNKVNRDSIIITQLDESLTEHVECMIIEQEEAHNNSNSEIALSEVKWHVYNLHKFGGQAEQLQEDHNDESITLFTAWSLPAVDFHGLWENLIYDTNIKEDLLQYVSTMMIFSEKGVDPNIVCSNRVVLLHGPPGTGKTSLCKALAHKLSVRLQHRYRYAQLVEINSHSLFSKWFSESGKLVSKMFSRIHDMVEDPTMLVCVLIDEIESLAHARSQCLSGNEPSDSIRVVNAVLTNIDQIKRYPNVLILTTSNMTSAIDIAFVDRADIKQYIGLPSIYAIYQIYHSCIRELMRVQVIQPNQVILPVAVMKFHNLEMMNCTCEYSKKLFEICEKSTGFSGRTLRKVPFIGHALFSKKRETVTLANFLNSLILATEYLKKENSQFNNHHHHDM